jgi:hypothetical protein
MRFEFFIQERNGNFGEGGGKSKIQRLIGVLNLINYGPIKCSLSLQIL